MSINKLASKTAQADALRANLVGSLPTVQSSSQDVVEVEVGFSHVMKDYARELYVQFRQAMEPREILFSEADLMTYLKCLLAERVRRIRRERTDVKPEDGHNVPAMFSVILEMIGKCSDEAIGIHLVPSLTAELRDLETDKQFMHSMHLKLMPMKNQGFVFARGIPKPAEGDFDFMSFEVIEQSIRHMRDDKPAAYAVAAAMLGIVGLGTFFGKVCYRSDYGNMKEMSLRATELALPRTVLSS